MQVLEDSSELLPIVVEAVVEPDNSYYLEQVDPAFDDFDCFELLLGDLEAEPEDCFGQLHLFKDLSVQRKFKLG